MSQIIAIITLFVLFSFKANALCINASMANLRAKPSSNSAITWVVGRHTPLVYLKSKGAWYQVKDQDGERHWVHSGLVTSRYKCLSILTSRANLRTGAGSHFPKHKYRAAEKYEAFKRLQKQDSWYEVKNNYGNVMWVHKSNVFIPRRNISINF